MDNNLDKDVVNLAKAIRQTESNNNFNARSKDGSYGAYQFLKPTWDNTARKYGINAQWDKATPAQQNEVAYRQLKEWKDKGYNVGQIASMWNAGAGKPDAYLQNYAGVNKYGVKYDTPGYAKKVATAYQQFKQQYGGVQPIQQPATPPEKTIEQQKQENLAQGKAVSVRDDRVDPTFLGNVVRGIVKPVARFAQNVRGIGEMAGGDYSGDFKVNKAGESKLSRYLGDIKAVGQDENFGKALLDTIGTSADIASNFIGGEGAVALGKAGIKQGAKQFIKSGVKTGLTQGAFHGFGSGAQREDATLGSSIKQGIGEGILGAATGGLLAGGGYGVGKLGQGIVNKISPSEEFLKKGIDKNIRNIFTGTTADIGKVDDMAFKAKKGLELLVKESPNINIPDESAPLGSNVMKQFDIATAKPNEMLSAVLDMDKKISSIARESAEEASRMGAKIDTSDIEQIIINSGDEGLIGKSGANTILKQIQSTQGDPLKVHDWVQLVNNRFRKNSGELKDNMTAEIAEKVAKELRSKLDSIVDRTGYAEAFGNNQELKRMLVAIAKKANKKVDFGDIASDAGLDSAIALLTGQPLYMARTIGSGLFKGILKNLRNNSGLRSLRKAVSGVSRLPNETKLPSKGTKIKTDLLQLPAPAIRAKAPIGESSVKLVPAQKINSNQYSSEIYPQVANPAPIAQIKANTTSTGLGKNINTRASAPKTTQKSKGSISRTLPPLKKGTSGKLNDLITEAKKYKSAEDFVEFNKSTSGLFNEKILPGYEHKYSTYRLKDFLGELAPRQYKDIGDINISMVEPNNNKYGIGGNFPSYTNAAFIIPKNGDLPFIVINKELKGDQLKKAILEEVEHALTYRKNPEFVKTAAFTEGDDYIKNKAEISAKVNSDKRLKDAESKIESQLIEIWKKANGKLPAKPSLK